MTMNPVQTARAAQNAAATAEAEAAQLERAAEAARIERERLAAEAAAADKHEAAWRRRARSQAAGWVEVLESRQAELRKLVDDGRPAVETRVAARRFLHPSGEPGMLADLLGNVTARDWLVGQWAGLQLEAGRVMRRLAEEAMVDVTDELADRADAVEATAWGACMARVRWLAGEAP